MQPSTATSELSDLLSLCSLLALFLTVYEGRQFAKGALLDETND